MIYSQLFGPKPKTTEESIYAFNYTMISNYALIPVCSQKRNWGVLEADRVAQWSWWDLCLHWCEGLQLFHAGRDSLWQGPRPTAGWGRLSELNHIWYSNNAGMAIWRLKVWHLCHSMSIYCSNWMYLIYLDISHEQPLYSLINACESQPPPLFFQVEVAGFTSTSTCRWHDSFPKSREAGRIYPLESWLARGIIHWNIALLMMLIHWEPFQGESWLPTGI